MIDSGCMGKQPRLEVCSGAFGDEIMAFVIRQRWTKVGGWGIAFFVMSPTLSSLLLPKFLKLLWAPTLYASDKDAFILLSILYVALYVTMFLSVPMMLIGREQIMRQVSDAELIDPDGSGSE